MSDTVISDDMDTNFNEVFQQTSTYFQGLIARETFPFQLATHLNTEVPAKMEDTRRNLVALLEERLAEQGEKAASDLKAQLRIRYYEDRIENKLAAECRIEGWSSWMPTLSEYTRNTGAVLTGAFGLAAALAALKATGLTSIKIPIYAASPCSTAVIYAALAVLSGVATTHPEKVPTLMERERRRATEHVAGYLRNAQIAFLNSARKAEDALDAYFEQLQRGN